MLKKKTGVKLKIGKTILMLILVILPSASLTAFVVGICNNFLPLFFTLAFGGCVSVVSFVLLCGVFNLIDVKAFLIKSKDYLGKIGKKKVKMKKA